MKDEEYKMPEGPATFVAVCIYGISIAILSTILWLIFRVEWVSYGMVLFICAPILVITVIVGGLIAMSKQ